VEHETREKWATRVARWRSGGLTAGEFARREGVNESTLRWWSSRLRVAERDAGAVVSPLTFVELTAAAHSEPIEVILVSGVRLRLPPDFDAPAVERLLGVLERRR